MKERPRRPPTGNSFAVTVLKQVSTIWGFGTLILYTDVLECRHPRSLAKKFTSKEYWPSPV
jgi:hypothetical protein